MNTQISDELLSAYIDGELDDGDRARVEQAIARDARLAQRVAQQRALRGRLRNVFDGALRESVPQRLVNARRLDRPSTPAQIIDLARVRAERARRPERRRVTIPRRAALTVGASVLVGIGAGLLVQRVFEGSALTEYRDGSLFAAGSLSRALNEQLASTGMTANPVHIGFTFRSKSNNYCRLFTLNNTHMLTGIACREAPGWRLLTLLATEPGATAASIGYRIAGSTLPAPLQQAVDERISGPALDAAAELKARRNGWH